MDKKIIERRLMGNIAFKRGLYSIMACEKQQVICLADLGIKVLNDMDEIYYSDLYKIKDNKLNLMSIRIEDNHGIYPPINNVVPENYGSVVFYKMLRLPVAYTGTIIVKRGYRQINGYRNSLINKLFGYKMLYQITFKDGMVISCKNKSMICRRIQWISKHKARIINKQQLTRLQTLFMRDCSVPFDYTLSNLYNYYMEYFKSQA